LKKLSLPQLLVLNTYWLGLSFMWNALHPIILPAVLLNYVPDDKKNTYLGLLTFLGLVIAMVVQPVSGAISDGWKSRFGRRRPLMVFGTLFDFVFLSILAWTGGLSWLFIGYVGLQLSSNIAHGPLQGLLPDIVPQRQLGVASSLKTFMDMFALVIASLLAGRMIDPETRDPTTIMLTVILLLAVTASITIFGVRERPTGKSERTDWKALSAQFHVSFRENSAYWWLVLERAIFLLGIFGVQAFAQYYLQDVLRVPDPPRQTGDLLAILTIALVVLVLIGGWLTDKYGAKLILYIATFVAASGILLMVFARDMRGVFVFGSLLGAGLGLFLTSNWALANALVPEAEAGKYLGLTNLATAGSGALARLEGPILDWLNHLWPGLWVGYKGLFLFGGIAIFLSLFILRKIDVKPRENPNELQEQYPTNL
jgi:MFS family permease